MNVYSNSVINKWGLSGGMNNFSAFLPLKCSFIIHSEDRLVKFEKTPSSYNKKD